jgi:glucose-6-phosphate 1-dehydrogenase
MFRGTLVDRLAPNRLVFHIQPYQGIELLFQAKSPGPTVQLQKVDMAFHYGDAFKASRYTGYEVMVYSCTRGDATLFSRGDLVDAAWKIAQPILEYWKANPVGDEFPNYLRGSWGPPVATELIERDGREWFEVVTTEMLEQQPLFKGAEPLLLNAVVMALQSASAAAGEPIVTIGEKADEMYLICRGEAHIVDRAGSVVGTLRDGDFFGEVGLLLSTSRTATVRAKTPCDLFVLKRSDFSRILRDHPHFAETLTRTAMQRYELAISRESLLSAG